jgi:hypothetical protein
VKTPCSTEWAKTCVPREADVFFERAEMLDTKVGQSKKDDPADVARVGYDAMMRGDGAS